MAKNADKVGRSEGIDQGDRCLRPGPSRASARYFTEVGISQKPAKQKRVAHWSFVVHGVPTGPAPVPTPPLVVPPPAGAGASHLPFVQLALQQSRPVVHVPASAVHCVKHFLSAPQWPEQQSPSTAQVAALPRHALGGAMQRFVSLSQRSLSFVAKQQPR
jgi:hypothetical protein